MKQITKRLVEKALEETEGAKFWLKVVTELKNRGIEDILIACVDGLKGFPEALESVFPKVTVQTCIVHMIRNSTRFVGCQDRTASGRGPQTDLHCGRSRSRARSSRSLRRHLEHSVPDDRPIVAHELGARGSLPRVPARTSDASSTPPTPSSRSTLASANSSTARATSPTTTRPTSSSTSPSSPQRSAGSDRPRAGPAPSTSSRFTSKDAFPTSTSTKTNPAVSPLRRDLHTQKI